jgi:hypothetical protein
VAMGVVKGLYFRGFLAESYFPCRSSQTFRYTQPLMVVDLR